MQMDGMQEILQMAGKLKNAQPDVQAKRKRWESYPVFLQNTLVAESHPIFPFQEPSCGFSTRYDKAIELKNEGNELFQKSKQAPKVSQKDFPDEKRTYDSLAAPELLVLATTRYEAALGIFRFCKKIRKEREDEIVFVDDYHNLAVADDSPINLSHRIDLKSLLVALYSNLAICYFNLSKYPVCIQACEHAIALDPHHVKCHTRGGLAYVRMEEFEKGVEWLQKANQLSGGDNPIIAAELQRNVKMRNKVRQQERKTFGGLFDRGNIYDGKEPAAGSPSAREDQSDPVYNFVREFVEKDFPNAPNKEQRMLEMRQSAERSGLDLSDPLVQEELKRLQAEKLGEKITDHYAKGRGLDPPEELFPKNPPKYNIKRWLVLFVFVLGFIRIVYFLFRVRQQKNQDTSHSEL